jgi:hypothetical protein
VNKEEWRSAFIGNIKNTNWQEKSFSVRKVHFGGPVKILRRLAPGILRILKKPY